MVPPDGLLTIAYQANSQFKDAADAAAVQEEKSSTRRDIEEGTSCRRAPPLICRVSEARESRTLLDQRSAAASVFRGRNKPLGKNKLSLLTPNIYEKERETPCEIELQ
jgi:hypothetical protein